MPWISWSSVVYWLGHPNIMQAMAGSNPIRNPLLPAKAVDSQPAVSRSRYVYNWLVSWHIWGVRIRTGKLPWQWGLAKLPCSEHAVTVISPQLETKTKSQYQRYPQTKSLFQHSRLSILISVGWSHFSVQYMMLLPPETIWKKYWKSRILSKPTLGLYLCKPRKYLRK